MVPLTVLAQLEEHLAKREWVRLDREAQRLALFESLSPRQLGRVYRAWGRAKSGLNDPYAGIQLLTKALPHALRSKDWDCLGFARADLGALSVLVGDIDAGVNYLEAFLLDSPRYDDAKALQGKVRFNLALAYKHRREYEAAIGQYERAIEWCTLRGHTLEKAMAHQNLAWLLCTVGRASDAHAHLVIADGFREALSVAFDAEQVCCWAFYFFTTDQLGSAVDCVQEVLLARRAGVEDYHRGQAAVVAAKVALRLGQELWAKQLVNKATHWAVEAADPALASECSLVRLAIQQRWGWSQEAAQ